VIGAGHAGCEAALAAARLKANTLLLSINMDSIAAMPCNSSIGGPGRGQMVREIDALGGEMAKNTDRTFLHMRMLNTSRGPAVRTLRAGIDKREYFLAMKKIVENQENLTLRQAMVVNIGKDKGLYFLETSDCYKYFAKCVILCTGTFLRGKVFWGANKIEAGRQGEVPSNKLSRNLEKLGIRFGRLNTNTPPRVDSKAIDFRGLKLQYYDDHPEMFSFEDKYDGRSQFNNHMTHIGEDGIDYIKKNLNGSFFAKLESEGPKYCPSIEEKVTRYPDKKSHLLFIQPEGRRTSEMYIHGLMTTLSEEIQAGMLKKIKGLKKAVITRPGYGVEYDYILPFQINNRLECKKLKGLFFAGQINGTTGYEEAAAQGIIAGINAGRMSQDKNGIQINREDGYIGVLIDDLVSRKITEPYRMLTSRNEFRLYHRHDNADYRMLKFLKIIGFNEKAQIIEEKYEKIHLAGKEILENNNFGQPTKESFYNKYKDILKGKYKLCTKDIDSVYINLKYREYIERQVKEIEKIKNSLDFEIPQKINYKNIKNISNEAILALEESKPDSLRQARRLQGVSPSDFLSLLCYLKMFHVKHRKK